MNRILRLRRQLRISRGVRRYARAWTAWMWSARNHSLPQDVSACGGQVSLFPLLHLPSILPPTTPCRPDGLSGVFSHRAYRRTHRTRCAASSRTKRLGLRLSLAGSPRQQAESSLRRPTRVGRYCGLDVRLRLLPTPPPGDAVTFGYEEPDIPRRGLSPRQCNNIAGALAEVASLPMLPEV